MSHPAGGAWIEIFFDTVDADGLKVAPRRGCVDRNYVVKEVEVYSIVAPRRGCVDRNKSAGPYFLMSAVAPRRGCVDRNYWF